LKITREGKDGRQSAQPRKIDKVKVKKDWKDPVKQREHQILHFSYTLPHPSFPESLIKTLERMVPNLKGSSA